VGEAVKPSVLIVEDDAVARTLAGRILQPHYEVDYAADAHEARGKLIGGLVDLLLIDLYMPGESGMDLAEFVLSRWPDEMAVVMVTGADDPEMADRAFELGAYGYLVKPYRSGDLLITVSSALRRQQLEQTMNGHQRQLERDLVSKGLENERVRQLLNRSEASLERSRLETVHKLSLAVEMRDQVTGLHLSRMGAYCEEIAERMKLSTQVSETIALAGQMHDIGKIAVPDHILLKVGPLTPGERRQMETHADVGRKILQGSESPLLQLAESIAWTHHEKWNGTGYPRGLSGEDIPIEGRIAAVADVFDALIRDRPYRRAMPMEEAMSIMNEGRGTHFDPAVLDLFLRDIPASPALGTAVSGSG
jgi:putative two-component system response regulator